MPPAPNSLFRDFARALDPAEVARDLGFALDSWQDRLIADPPRRALILCGRQVGKSTSAALCALNSVAFSPPSTVIMVSPSQRQSMELFRTLHSMWLRLPNRPEPQYETLQRLEFVNGSRVLSLPGSSDTVRGIASVDLLIIDEAARVDDSLLAAVRPMLAVSDGKLFALTTPAGKRGWFYEQWMRGVGWHRTSIKSTECARISQEFLDQEREQLGPMLFGQEYLCEFHDTEGSAFLSELIDAAFVHDFEPFLPDSVRMVPPH